MYPFRAEHQPRTEHKSVLLLGGTLEARQLATRLARCPDIDLTLSLAGRTRTPIDNGVPTRSGGFGGVAGLADYLKTQRIDALIVATHPFAATIAHNAHEAARLARVPVVRVTRPEWPRHADDRWIDCDNACEATELLGEMSRRVLLTFGREQAAIFERAPQHHYLVRSIDPINPPLTLPHVDNLLARGPFTLDDERRLLRDHRVDVLVTRHSGGAATWPKLQAARELGVQVIMIRRPAMPDTPVVDSAAVDNPDRLAVWLQTWLAEQVPST